MRRYSEKRFAWLVIPLLGVSIIGGLTSASAESTAPAYQARGTVDWQMGSSTNIRHHVSAFVVTVAEHHWSIMLMPKEWPRTGPNGRVLVSPRKVEASYDGTNVYHHLLNEFDTNDFSRGSYNPAGPKNGRSELGDRWIGSVPHPSHFACPRELMALWYAFGSADYWPRLPDPQIVPLDDIAPNLGNSGRAPATYALSKAPPNLPISISMSNGPSLGKDQIRIAFAVQETTNWDGLTLPAMVSVEYYHSRLGSTPWSRTAILVTSVGKPPEKLDLVPVLGGKTWLTERTFESNRAQGVRIAYTNSWLGVSNKAWRRPTTKPTLPKTGINESRRHIILAFLFFLGFLPPAAVWWTRKGKGGNHSNH